VSKLNVALVVVAAVAGTISATARAADGDFDPWEVRARFVRLDSRAYSDPIPALGLPGDAVNVHSKNLPEVDISYFFTKNIAAELILTYPQKMNVSIDGVGIGPIGHVSALPPTLTGQYHFNLTPAFDPYVGAGVNFTWLTNVDLVVPGAPQLNLTTSKTSFGGAFQVGADYKVYKNWVLNADVKYAWISYELKSNGNDVSTLKVDPWLLGVGIGYKF